MLIKAEAQLSSAEAEAAAREAGLDYVHVPVPSGGMQPAHMQAFRQAVRGGGRVAALDSHEDEQARADGGHGGA